LAQAQRDVHIINPFAKTLAALGSQGLAKAHAGERIGSPALVSGPMNIKKENLELQGKLWAVSASLRSRPEIRELSHPLNASADKEESQPSARTTSFLDTLRFSFFNRVHEVRFEAMKDKRPIGAKVDSLNRDIDSRERMLQHAKEESRTILHAISDMEQGLANARTQLESMQQELVEQRLNAHSGGIEDDDTATTCCPNLSLQLRLFWCAICFGCGQLLYLTCWSESSIHRMEAGHPGKFLFHFLAGNVVTLASTLFFSSAHTQWCKPEYKRRRCTLLTLTSAMVLIVAFISSSPSWRSEHEEGFLVLLVILVLDWFTLWWYVFSFIPDGCDFVKTVLRFLCTL